MYLYIVNKTLIIRIAKFKKKLLDENTDFSHSFAILLSADESVTNDQYSVPVAQDTI